MADHSSPPKHTPHVDDTTVALLHSLPDPALLIDVDGTIRAANAAAIAVIGEPAEDLIGTSAYHDSPVITGEIKRRIEEVIRSKKPLRTEEVHEGRRVDHALYPVVDKRGTVIQLVAISRDITEERYIKEERQRLSKQVKEQERTLGGILSASADLIYVFDRDVRYHYVNLPGARALGSTPEDIVGKTWKEVGLPRKSTRRMVALADVVFATGRPQTEEVEWKGADGATLCYEYILTPIFNTRGEVASIVSRSRDITERKRMEAQLAESERKYRELVETAWNIIVTVNTEGIITFINEYGAHFFGYAPDELIGKNVMIFIPEIESTGRPLTPLINDILAHPDDHAVNVNENITKDGRRVWVNWMNRSLTDVRGHHVGHLAIGNDVTKQKRAEEALKRAHAELEYRVKERTRDLQEEIEERKVVEEELRTMTEDVLANAEKLKRAEQSALEHARTVGILNRVITAGNEATDLQTMLSSMLDTAVELMKFDGGTIYLINDAQRRTELQYQQGYAPEFVKKKLESVPLTQKNIALVYKGEALFSEDYITDALPGFNPGNIQARASIPLIARDNVIGHYTVFSRRPHRFTREERELLLTLGREVGTVIAKMQVEEQEKEHLRLIDLATDAIVVRDLDHHALSWNRGAEMIFGWTGAEAIGRHVPTLLQTEFPVSFEEAQEVLLHDGYWRGEVRCTTKSGAPIIVNHHWTLKRDDAGHPTTILTISNNITEQKQAEEQLRAASLYSRGLLEASLDSLVTISAEGAITDVNKATEEVTGFSREQLIGSDFSSYFTDPGKANAGYKKVFTDGSVRDYPLAIRRKSGKIIDVLYNATVYWNEAGEVQGVFAAARDVTERKRAEEALRRAHDELEQIVRERTNELQEEIEERKVTEEELRISTEELQEKTAELEELTQELRRSNQELEQFAYIASHDLQEPLRTVTSSIGLLEQWYKDKLGEEADTFITYAVDGTKHMQQLIKDLLAYSRVMSRGEAFKPVHCEGVVQHAIDNLKAAIEESGATITLPKKPLPMVMGDKTQLTQLFQNLFGNAIKFRSAHPPEVQIRMERDEKRKRWQFSIKDNGIGMDMQYVDKIFTIFQRLHTTEQYPGTGVGLALCKRIVERHGGEIWVESKLGKGSTFYFTLPFNVES
jgi:PAS domain S-box-containing protein